ncbi:MAG: hypothetical protein ACTSRI_08565 [Promethearchaeota archaeon]
MEQKNASSPLDTVKIVQVLGPLLSDILVDVFRIKKEIEKVQ